MEMEVDTTSDAYEKTASDNLTEDEEEILVYVKFDDVTDDYLVGDLKDMKILGLNTKEPILQIGNKIYGGTWKDTVGTATFFEETAPTPKRCYFSTDVPKPLKFLTKTQKTLQMKRVFITPKTTSTEVEDTDRRNEDNVDEASQMATDDAEPVLFLL